MNALNNLEVAALEAIAEQYSEQKAQLLIQFRAAKFVERSNTGAGFFTNLWIDRDGIAPVYLHSPIGDVYADIDGFQSPMGFLVFMQDGYASFLEGFTTCDKTSGIDFGQVNFAIQPNNSVGTPRN